MTTPRFIDLTETTGTPISEEGAVMMYSRYAFAAGLAEGSRVLELGCGSGLGFGLLGARARQLVGGDIDGDLLARGRRHFGDEHAFVQLSAEDLPFRDASFDLVLFFEASYYVPDMERAFDEITRVLAARGACVFVNANPERKGFIPSPHSHRYHSAAEFAEALRVRGFDVVTEGAFPIAGGGGMAATLVRGALQGLGLVPRTLKGRARLKRLLLRPLVSLPPELPPHFRESAHRFPAESGRLAGFKVIYVTARR